MDISEWLSTTTAAQIMTHNVVSFQPNAILAAAAAVMLREQISGAPVVDESGKCVGVLSVNDLLQAEEKVVKQQEAVAQSPFFNSGLALPASVYEAQLLKVRDKLAPAAEHPVKDFMTTDLVTVPENASASTIIQYLIDAHIHRVIVLDDDERLAGLVSATDILAALHQQAGTRS